MMLDNLAKDAATVRTVAWWQRLVVVACWILVWEGASVAIGNPIVLCGPLDVLIALVHNAAVLSFWLSIAFSLLRIAVGFVLACVAGFLFGVFAARSNAVRVAIEPLVSVVKSTPIVCVIVLLLIWIGAADVPIAAVFLAVFPSMYAAALEGVSSVDKQMDEMLHAFRVPLLRRVRFLYLPTLMPFLRATMMVGIGMSWKAGIAAELIGIPRGSIGAQIYTAKITLETSDLLAWTAVVVILSLICERVALLILNALAVKANHPSVPKASCCVRDDSLVEGALLDAATKSYGTCSVLNDVSLEIAPGDRVCLMGPSGVGKTTLLRVLCGFETLDAGSLLYSERHSGYQLLGVSHHLHAGVVFQDVRLFDQVSAFGNLALVPSPHSTGELRALLEDLLPGKDFSKPVSEYSGGMKRRVELCRALASDCGCIVLDEPFTGLDAATKNLVMHAIDRWLHGRTLIISSHDRSDAECLGARVILM